MVDKQRKKKMRDWLEKYLGGHVTIKWFGWNLTIYGFNAMHVAVNFHTRRWGWVCFHPPIHFLDWNWPWKFYMSPNATPSAATYAIGPGLSKQDKRKAKLRAEVLGHNYRVSDYEYGDIINIDEALKSW